MKLTYHQLEQHLSKNVAPIYLVSGDELLLVQEAVAAIRFAAQKAGATERTSLTADAGSDWEKLLYAEINSLSLFATKRLIELRIPAKPNSAASKMLQNITAKLSADTVLIIISNKLDSKAEQTAWYKAIDKNGVTLPIWPITVDQLPAWIMQRAKKSGLKITADAAKILATQVEGNLLAAATEIEKLGLLNIDIIDSNTIDTAVTDNARYDIFSLVDCALAGNSKRCIRILNTLQTEDSEPILILWALARELRTLAELRKQVNQGVSLTTLFSKYRIWEKRQPVVRRFLQHHTTQSCWQLLSQSASIDRLLKGARSGNIWDELQQVTLKIAASK
jgi:DNA polymerase-3 subunit delta